MEIKSRLDSIEDALNEQYPHFKANQELTEQITNLKDYVEAEYNKIQKQKKKGGLSELESAFIEPAINEVYSTSLDKIRRGSKPSESVNEHICDTSFTLNYWIRQIQDRR
ncbi:hypothetical protein [Citrobacter sp. BDA59-3]|uniref:hypothetical protein n=1 Tax=Citrobacter sp. BDA59-3 TaxID=2781952 RepID=UPI001D15D2E6|nr:hypothetical protein [Citrobacter sp. BDA59-3]